MSSHNEIEDNGDQDTLLTKLRRYNKTKIAGNSGNVNSTPSSVAGHVQNQDETEDTLGSQRCSDPIPGDASCSNEREDRLNKSQPTNNSPPVNENEERHRKSTPPNYPHPSPDEREERHSRSKPNKFPNLSPVECEERHTRIKPTKYPHPSPDEREERHNRIKPNKYPHPSPDEYEERHSRIKPNKYPHPSPDEYEERHTRIKPNKYPHPSPDEYEERHKRIKPSNYAPLGPSEKEGKHSRNKPSIEPYPDEYVERRYRLNPPLPDGPGPEEYEERHKRVKAGLYPPLPDGPCPDDYEGRHNRIKTTKHQLPHCGQKRDKVIPGLPCSTPDSPVADKPEETSGNFTRWSPVRQHAQVSEAAKDQKESESPRSPPSDSFPESEHARYLRNNVNYKQSDLHDKAASNSRRSSKRKSHSMIAFPDCNPVAHKSRITDFRTSGNIDIDENVNNLRRKGSKNVNLLESGIIGLQDSRNTTNLNVSVGKNSQDGGNTKKIEKSGDANFREKRITDVANTLQSKEGNENISDSANTVVSNRKGGKLSRKAKRMRRENKPFTNYPLSFLNNPEETNGQERASEDQRVHCGNNNPDDDNAEVQYLGEKSAEIFPSEKQKIKINPTSVPSFNYSEALSQFLDNLQGTDGQRDIEDQRAHDAKTDSDKSDGEIEYLGRKFAGNHSSTENPHVLESTNPLSIQDITQSHPKTGLWHSSIAGNITQPSLPFPETQQNSKSQNLTHYSPILASSFTQYSPNKSSPITQCSATAENSTQCSPSCIRLLTPKSSKEVTSAIQYSTPVTQTLATQVEFPQSVQATAQHSSSVQEVNKQSSSVQEVKQQSSSVQEVKQQSSSSAPKDITLCYTFTTDVSQNGRNGITNITRVPTLELGYPPHFLGNVMLPMQHLTSIRELPQKFVSVESVPPGYASTQNSASVGGITTHVDSPGKIFRDVSVANDWQHYFYPVEATHENTHVRGDTHRLATFGNNTERNVSANPITQQSKSTDEVPQPSNSSNGVTHHSNPMDGVTEFSNHTAEITLQNGFVNEVRQNSIPNEVLSEGVKIKNEVICECKAKSNVKKPSIPGSDDPHISICEFANNKKRDIQAQISKLNKRIRTAEKEIENWTLKEHSQGEPVPLVVLDSDQETSEPESDIENPEYKTDKILMDFIRECKKKAQDKKNELMTEMRNLTECENDWERVERNLNFYAEDSEKTSRAILEEISVYTRDALMDFINESTAKLEFEKWDLSDRIIVLERQLVLWGKIKSLREGGGSECEIEARKIIQQKLRGFINEEKEKINAELKRYVPIMETMMQHLERWCKLKVLFRDVLSTNTNAIDSSVESTSFGENSSASRVT